MTVNKYEKEIVNTLVDEIYDTIHYSYTEYANGKAHGYLNSCQTIINKSPDFDEELFKKVDKAWADIIEWSQKKKDTL